MRLTAKIKLVTDANQNASLFGTMALANKCCNWLSEKAWSEKMFTAPKLQKNFYYSARDTFWQLSAQAVLLCMRKVADAYKLDKKTKREFRDTGSIAYDLRILSWKADSVSIWTIDGRKKIPFVCGEHQRKQLQNQHGQTDLLLQDGTFYLATCVDAFEEPVQYGTYKQPLGVDLGVAKIATDSDGNVYSGSKVKSIRHRHLQLRSALQKAGTQSAKRHLKKLSGKEARFARDTNHIISKQIVRTAKGTSRGIAIEDLSGIRDRITVRKSQRAVLHSWSFFQLRAFLEYKAALSGVSIVAIDARNTSRECSECGYTDKKNRKTQDKFLCLSCGHTDNADKNAARVISSRVYVITPIVGQAQVLVPTSPDFSLGR
jgi:IS605 OrfB family transposase